MTAFIPSARVTVQRGQTTDAYGDPVDAAVTVATGLPAAVAEDQQRRYRPAEQRGTLIERFTIRLRPGSDVREGDRLVDERTGAVYQVQDVTYPPRVVGAADVRVTAVRVAALSSP